MPRAARPGAPHLFLFALALAALSLLPRPAAAAAPFIASPFYSKFQRLTRVSGDIADNGTLAAAIEHKSYRNEIIVFAFNAAWMEWAVAMAAQLRHVGFDHYLALSFDAAACDALRDAAPYASCVFSSIPGAAQSAGWVGQTQGAQALWIARYYACTRLAAAGISVLMLDLDTIIYRDPYPELHAPPLADVALIHLKEGFANGGLFYLRRHESPEAVAVSPAMWVHTHVLWKANLIVEVEHRDKQHLGTFMDQALLNDNLNAAGCNSSAWDMPSVYVTGDRAWDNPFWKTRSSVSGKTAAELSVRKEGTAWYCEWSRSADKYGYGGGAAAECTGAADEATCGAAFEHYVRNTLADKPLEFLTLRIPLDFEPPPPAPRVAERFAAAPEWVFGHCDAAHSGWRSSALIHLVACSADWGDAHEWTHVGRRALMVAAGAWRREAVLPTPSRPRFLALSPAGVESAAAAAAASKAGFSALIQRVIAAALGAGRIPVLPGLPCASLTWLERAPWAKDGIFDRRVIRHRELCFPAPGGAHCGHAQAIGGYELSVLYGHSLHGTAAAAGDGDVEAVSAARPHEQPADVLLLDDLAAAPRDSGGGDAAQLRQLCHAYYE